MQTVCMTVNGNGEVYKMFDYKPIADAMRHCKYKTTKAECKACAIHGICKKYKGFLEDYAADVIEQLQKERDAAIADLETIAKHLNKPCYWCAYYSNVVLVKCMMCDDEEHNGNFEWRGLSLESKTSDKEVER